LIACAALSIFPDDTFDQRSRRRYVRLVGYLTLQILTP
jgi:hypothetical protein